MKSIKQHIIKIYLSAFKKLFFYTNSEFKMCEDILNIKFSEIQHPKLNHFNSDNLNIYIDFGDNHYISGECYKVKELLKKILLKDKYISKIHLTKINSLNASKSKKIHKSIYFFGHQVHVKEKVNWTFDECIKHVLKKHKLLYLDYYLWNNKYHWINSDGSHHFAVAQYIAINKKIDYFFDCHITSISIDEKIVTKLILDYELFIVHKNVSYAFSEIFQRNKICILQHRRNDEVLIALTKDEFLPKKVIRLLNKIDNKYIFNVSNYLNKLILKQQTIEW